MPLNSEPVNVLFLFSENPPSGVRSLIKRHLSAQIKLEISLDFPVNPEMYDLIVPWNFQKKIPVIPEPNNVVVFHSSDLPEGRGWAPIANLFLNDIKKYTLTAFYIADKIDSGNMILKASFPINESMTARFLRQIDDLLIIRLSIKIAQGMGSQKYKGVIQPTSGSTKYPKRKPELNEIKLSQTIETCLPLLRAAEANHECFFILGSTRYTLVATPESISLDNVSIQINYLTNGEFEEFSISAILSENSGYEFL